MIELLTENWETMQEIQKRTGIDGEVIAQSVKIAFTTRKANILFAVDGTKFRAEEWTIN